MENDNQCPRCWTGRLRSWSDLSGEEQELVKRLPASADHSLAEREALHRWCPRCWHETGGGAARA